MKVWIDGEIVPGDAARIPVTDHGLLYGDGVFEGIRVRGGRVFRLDAHMRRLSHGANALALELPGGVARVREIVLETVRAFGQPESYVRLLVTRGEGALGVDPTSCPKPRVVCIVDRIEIYSEEKRARGIDLVTASTRRPPPDVLDPRVKSLNYLPSAMAKLEARRAGADEALLLNTPGHVAEASVANVFVVRDGVLCTPPTTDGALEGINRAAVLDLCATLGIPAAERTIGRLDFFASEEAFLTGSGAGIVPVRSLDGRPIGAGAPGPLYAKIRSGLEDLFAAEGVPFEAAGRAAPGALG